MDQMVCRLRLHFGKPLIFNNIVSWHGACKAPFEGGASGARHSFEVCP
jgi:hypothetical protein